MSVYVPPFQIPIFRPGVPSDGELVFATIAMSPFVFTTGTWLVCKSKTAFTSEAVFVFKRNGTQFGTATFAAASTVAVISKPVTLTLFSVSQSLEIYAPDPADGTGADIEFALLATRLT